MARSTSLTVEILTDATDAVAGLSSTSASLDDLGRSAQSTSGKLQASTRGVQDFADSADAMEGKAAKATGALGALSSGFELAGLTGAADTLNQAAMATDFVSGAMDSFTLLTELNTVAMLKNKAASLAQTVATTAQTAATKAAAIAQRAFNLAMSLNPIGLIVAAVALLVGGFVLLYKKSDTFRALIATVGEIGKKALDGIKTAAGFLIDNLGKIVGWLLKFAIPLPFRLAIEGLERVLPKMAGWIQDAVEWVKKLSFPSPPKWLSKLVPGGSAAGAGVPAVAVRGVATTAAGPSVVVNFYGPTDPDAAARQIKRVLGSHDRRMGNVIGLRTV